MRTGSLSDHGPQRSDRTLRRSSLVAPALAWAVDDSVHSAAPAFLVRASLEHLKEKKEDKRKREKEELKKEKAKVLQEEEEPFLEEKVVLHSAWVCAVIAPTRDTEQLACFQNIITV